MKRAYTILVLVFFASCVALGELPSSGPINEAVFKQIRERSGDWLIVLDVRTPEEYAEGFIPGALLLPYDRLETEFDEEDKDMPIVVYCRSGRRSAIAAETLEAMGYRRVYDFGAVTKWKGSLETQ